MSVNLDQFGRTPESRRQFIGRFLAFSAVGVIAGCGGGSEGGSTAQDLKECENYDGLTEQDLTMRKTLNYVSNSPNANQVCSNCNFYSTPPAGQNCGGCTLFKGPVNPGGYCTSWTQKQA